MSALRGNCLMGQSGGPTAVINASICGVIQEAMRHPEIAGIYGAQHGILGVLREDLIDLRQEAAAQGSPALQEASGPGSFDRVQHLCDTRLG